MLKKIICHQQKSPVKFLVNIENTDEYLQLSPEKQKEFIDSMADYSRGYMDQGDWNINDALDAAFEDACNEFIEDEEEF